MTVTRQEMTTQEADVWALEDEIDLREYVEVLIKWWKEIVLLAVVAAAVAALGVIGQRLLMAPSYESSAIVAIARTRSSITFDPNFQTLSEEVESRLTDAASRRSALIGLVSNGAIAQSVLDELGEMLEEEERSPATLLDMVEAELGAGGDRANSDLIRIQVTADSPEKAATIANAWARYYVEQINTIYGQAPAELLTSVETELEDAQHQYEIAQANLEFFLARSQIDGLQRLIDEKRNIIINLQEGRQTAMAALVEEVTLARTHVLRAYLTAQTDGQLLGFTKEQEGKQRLLGAYLDALNQANQIAFDEQVQNHVRELQGYYDTRLNVSRLLDNARSLREQVEAGGEGAVASNALALQLLKTQVFASATDLPASLQVQVTNTPQLTLAEVRSDLDSLIQSLEERLATLDGQIERLTTDLLSGDNYAYLEQQVPGDSALVSTIVNQYSSLFDPGDLTDLGGQIAPDNPLAVAGQQKASDLLQLQGLEDLSVAIASEGSLNQAVFQLEGELQSLHSQLEAESARQRQLSQQRDLTWQTYTTLSNKAAELNLSSSAASSEVRFAAPAIPPLEPVAGPGLVTTTALAGVVGGMLAVFVAFFANFMGKEPFLNGRRPERVKAQA